MKAYQDVPAQKPQMVSDIAVEAYEVAYEVVRQQPCFFAPFDMGDKDDDDIPLDAHGKPIGTPWEVVRERMYDNLSKHYGVDLRTLQ
ncbi:hypothetical protein AGMMS49965_26490 [Bacteroidia bacterium]|nr:hypothetical protein AGMMS49965_26490 [Bacteroidia bacterium]